jgi:hypothetical protein
MVFPMTQCNYIYASGLRIKEGDGVVELDGKTLRVVRDGSGQSRPDLPLADPPSDGTITLRKLRAVLEERGDSSIKLSVEHHVSTYTRPEGEKQRFSVDMDPSAAMGRQGREGDFRDAAEKMTREDRTSAALYQLTTLPYSNKQSGSETADRLRFSIEEAGGWNEAFRQLDERFSLHADDRLLYEALEYASRTFAGRADMIRVAWPLMGDPARIPDKYFRLAESYFCLEGWKQRGGHKFVDVAFERMSDDSLYGVLYNGLTDERFRTDYLLVIADPDRLQRIIGWYKPVWMPDSMGPVSSWEGPGSDDHYVKFLSRVARSVGKHSALSSRGTTTGATAERHMDEPKFTGDRANGGREWTGYTYLHS